VIGVLSLERVRTLSYLEEKHRCFTAWLNKYKFKEKCIVTRREELLGYFLKRELIYERKGFLNVCFMYL
jgi:hypothetical protein